MALSETARLSQTSFQQQDQREPFAGHREIGMLPYMLIGLPDALMKL